jgi:ribonucleoside-triphosphate reductase
MLSNKYPNTTPSARAELITRRTYNRPIDDAATQFETWPETVDRVINHQKWLWERAKGADLTNAELDELEELRQIMLMRVGTPSGRTLWLGGTDVAKHREASQFNCSFALVETVHDVVDCFWLLLQGCGVGFKAVPGILSGFTSPVEVEVIRSQKVLGDPKGFEENFAEVRGDTFYISVGDSAEAWAKLPGKLLALKASVKKIVIDFSEVRAAGMRLKGYGWISSGDETISVAMTELCKILNKRAGKLLTAMDIQDILNWLGTTLSSRRSAEIAMMDAENPEIDDFIGAKKDFWEWYDEAGNKVPEGTPGASQRFHRQQSNNSIVFWRKPTKEELTNIFDKIVAAGGSEPGFINGQAAYKRAAWFKGVNPCAEILLGNKSFCNLVTPDWGKLAQMPMMDALRVLWIIARANYRQTCVNLKDGILQETWHELNEFLRLCGVGAAGIVKMFDHLKDENTIINWLTEARLAARNGAFSMADELGMPRPKAVTTVKPDGTVGKVFDTTEGLHRPLGKYIFNRVTYSKYDEVIPALAAAGYLIEPKPFEPDSVLVCFPVAYEDVKFDTVDGKEVNLETAVDQLHRYKLLMDHYVDHNASITVSYDVDEVPEIIDWVLENWDSYVGVSFIFRNDPTKTAEDLGYAYLPQSVVTKQEYEAYVSTLKPVDFDSVSSLVEDLEASCLTGACPIR